MHPGSEPETAALTQDAAHCRPGGPPTVDEAFRSITDNAQDVDLLGGMNVPRKAAVPI
jgi:hypothetical protein